MSWAIIPRCPFGIKKGFLYGYGAYQGKKLGYEAFLTWDILNHTGFMIVLYKILYGKSINTISKHAEGMGKRFGATIEKMEPITKGGHGSSTPGREEGCGVETLQAEDFHLENSTVWSFKNIDYWITSRYSKADERTLCPFFIDGITTVEVKLLDFWPMTHGLNPMVMKLTLKNSGCSAKIPLFYGLCGPYVLAGEERRFDPIDLILTRVRWCLSSLGTFCHPNGTERLPHVYYCVLKGGGADAFVRAVFKLGERVIKVQCKRKTCWLLYRGCAERNFFLFTHDYIHLSKQLEFNKECADGLVFWKYLPEIKGIDPFAMVWVSLFTKDEIFQCDCGLKKDFTLMIAEAHRYVRYTYPLAIDMVTSFHYLKNYHLTLIGMEEGMKGIIGWTIRTAPFGNPLIQFFKCEHVEMFMVLNIMREFSVKCLLVVLVLIVIQERIDDPKGVLEIYKEQLTRDGFSFYSHGEI